MRPAAPGLDGVLAHEAADLLVVHHQAQVQERGLDPAPAIAPELVADRRHGLDHGGVVTSNRGASQKVERAIPIRWHSRASETPPRRRSRT